MSNTDKLREIVEKHKFGYQEYVDHVVSEYTALISEDYVEKAKYDEAVRQRDELREAFNQMRQYWSLIDSEADAEQIAGSLWEVLAIAEAAIKNTDG